MKNDLQIENIQHHKHYIDLVSEWIYSEFISGQIPNCSQSDIKMAIEKRKIYEIPMTLVCIKNNECIGTISLFSNDLKKLPQLKPWIAALYVDKKFRNKGIGKLLINQIENIVKELGYNKIYLRTEKTSKYYLKLGWSKYQELKDEHNIDTIVFEKTIY